MAGQTRIFGLGVTAGTLYSHGASGFKLTVQNNSNSNIDLRAEDDAIDEAVEDVVPVFVVVVVAVVEELHSDSDLIFVINLISSRPLNIR